MQNAIPNLVKHFGRSPWSETLLDKCANPACSAKFRFLRDGKLFEIETESFAPSRADGAPSGRERRVEFCWLCDLCARFYVLSCDGKQVTTSPLQLEKGRVSAPIPIKKTVGSEGLRVHRPTFAFDVGGPPGVASHTKRY